MRIGLTFLAALPLSTTLMAAESFYGTWKLNVAKSKLQCSDIASETMTITETGPNSYNNVTDLVSKSGKARHQEGANRYLDGKERPIPGQPGVTQSIQRIDASTHKITTKKDGKVVVEITSTVSPDGKVQTNHRVQVPEIVSTAQVSDGKVHTNQRVQACDETMVFEKQ